MMKRGRLELNSPLVEYTLISPNQSGKRKKRIKRITPHCVVGQIKIENLANMFAVPSKQASSNYGIDKDGRVGMFVEEDCVSWCSSSSENDEQAVTIECASDMTAPYAFKPVVYDKLITLCIDICKRNGAKKLLWLEDKTKTLAYEPADDEIVLTVHRWFKNKSCPGEWMFERMGELAEKVTAALGGSTANEDSTTEKTDNSYSVQIGAFGKKSSAESYRKNAIDSGFDDDDVYITNNGKLYKVLIGPVDMKAKADKLCAKAKSAGFSGAYVIVNSSPVEVVKSEEFKPYLIKVNVSALNRREQPTINSKILGVMTKDGIKYTIVEESDGPGASKWGKLKTPGAGWISLDFCVKA